VVPVAEPISNVDGTRLSVNNALLLQICPVAELSHAKKDESALNEDKGWRPVKLVKVECASTVKAWTKGSVLSSKKKWGSVLISLKILTRLDKTPWQISLGVLNWADISFQHSRIQERLVFEMVIFMSFTKSHKAGDNVSGLSQIDLDMRHQIIALISDTSNNFVMQMHV